MNEPMEHTGPGSRDCGERNIQCHHDMAGSKEAPGTPQGPSEGTPPITDPGEGREPTMGETCPEAPPQGEETEESGSVEAPESQVQPITKPVTIEMCFVMTINVPDVIEDKHEYVIAALCALSSRVDLMGEVYATEVGEEEDAEYEEDLDEGGDGYA